MLAVCNPETCNQIKARVCPRISDKRNEKVTRVW